MTNILTSKLLDSRLTYKIILILSLAFLNSANLFAETSRYPQSQELVFLDHLLKNNPDVIDLIDEDELKRSNRFGITYHNEPVKFLINYNIPDEIKEDIIKKGKKFQADVKPLETDYSVLKFFYPEKNYSINFYFKDGKCIAPVTYFSKNYYRDSSQYFDFYIKNPLYFNEICKKELDQVLSIYLLNLSVSELNEISEKKVAYFFTDENDIANILGENAKGVFLVANDAILSSYNAHHHEVMHFIMNYKIKTDIKPCHPFFLEGFATGIGGRGGILMTSLFQVAKYSLSTGMVNLKSLLSVKNFQNEDASITYPIAGAYALSFIAKYGFDAYKSYYLKYSGDNDYLNQLDSTNMELPYLDNFYTALSYEALNFVNAFNNSPPDENDIVIDDPDFKLYKNDSNYVFLLSNKVLLKDPKQIFKYKSKLFDEKLPGMEYLNYNFLIEADSNEVNIYYLLTNCLLLSYKKAFDINSRPVSKHNDYYIFSVYKGFFLATKLDDHKYVTLE